MPLVSPEVQSAVEDIPPVPGYDHHVVLALPPHMGQALPVVHRLLIPPHGIFLEEGAYAISRRFAPRIARSSSGRTAGGRGFSMY